MLPVHVLPILCAAFSPPLALQRHAVTPVSRAPSMVLAPSYSSSPSSRAARLRFRRAALEHHPDRGGSLEAFLAASSSLEAELESARKQHNDCVADWGVLLFAAVCVLNVLTHHDPMALVLSAAGMLSLSSPVVGEECVVPEQLPEAPRPWFDTMWDHVRAAFHMPC